LSGYCIINYSPGTPSGAKSAREDLNVNEKLPPIVIETAALIYVTKSLIYLCLIICYQFLYALNIAR
jgi:hypothetical protein